MYCIIPVNNFYRLNFKFWIKKIQNQIRPIWTRIKKFSFFLSYLYHLWEVIISIRLIITLELKKFKIKLGRYWKKNVKNIFWLICFICKRLFRIMSADIVLFSRFLGSIHIWNLLKLISKGKQKWPSGTDWKIKLLKYPVLPVILGP